MISTIVEGGNNSRNLHEISLNVSTDSYLRSALYLEQERATGDSLPAIMDWPVTSIDLNDRLSSDAVPDIGTTNPPGTLVTITEAVDPLAATESCDDEGWVIVIASVSRQTAIAGAPIAEPEDSMATVSHQRQCKSNY